MNSSAASTWITFTPRCCAKVSITCFASFRRSRPWSTNTQVSCSPIAWWISAAATDGIDAAGQAEDHFLAAHLLADARRPLRRRSRACSSRRRSRRCRARSACRMARALQRVRDFGMELHARRSGATRRPCRRSGRRRCEAISLNPGGIAVTLSPWLIHTLSMPWPVGVARVLDAVEQLGMAARAHFGVAELAHRAGLDLAAQLLPPWSACRSRCRAPARPARTPPAARAACRSS